MRNSAATRPTPKRNGRFSVASADDAWSRCAAPLHLFVDGSGGGAFGLGSAQVLVEPRHDLDEIAGPIAVVELLRENTVPAVAAGARRSRQAEDKSRAGEAGGGAALDRRGADLGM